MLENIECGPLKFPKACNEDVEDFIRKCLKKNPEKRISWEEIYYHPIMKGRIATDFRNIEGIEAKFKLVMIELERSLSSFHLTSLISYQCINSSLFHKYLIKISVEITESESKACFARLDENNDGNIYLS